MSLRRKLTLLGAFSFGYADVGAGLYLTLGLVALHAGTAAPLAYAFASVAYMFTALTYAELASSIPEAGGGFVYTTKAFGEGWGFIAGWSLILDYVVTTAIFALATVGYLGSFLPLLHDIPYFNIASFGLVACLVTLNILGIKQSATFSAILVLANLVGIIAVFAVGFGLSNVELSVNGSLGSQGFLYGTSIAMASFLGIEVIAQTAEETRLAGVTIPRAVFLVSIAVVTISVTFSALAVSVMPVQELAVSFKDPAVAVVERLHFGGILALWVAVMGFAVCFVATNAGIVGVSRMVYSMSSHGLLPKWLGAIHSRTKTPYRAIVIFAALPLILAFMGQMGLAADLYNFGALLSYMLVNLSLIALRQKEPDRYRPFRLKGTIEVAEGRGRTKFPIVPIFGFFSAGAIWLLVVFTHETGRLLGFLWLLVGLSVYVLERKAKHESIG
jgi:APA family basic amino acid/polyamine antiporter